MSCEGMMYDWSSIYFAKAVNASREVVPLGFCRYMVAMAAGRFGGDRVVHRVRRARHDKYSGMLICCGLSAGSRRCPAPVTAVGAGFMMIGFRCVVRGAAGVQHGGKIENNGERAGHCRGE